MAHPGTLGIGSAFPAVPMPTRPLHPRVPAPAPAPAAAVAGPRYRGHGPAPAIRYVPREPGAPRRHAAPAGRFRGAWPSAGPSAPPGAVLAGAALTGASRPGAGPVATPPAGVTATGPTLVPRPASSSSGRILVAAVAVGALVPAVQGLDTHVADAAATHPQTDEAAMGLPHAPTAHTSPGRLRADTVAITADRSTAAGDVTDVTALTKSIGVTREAGPLKFGTPYVAGNDRTLDGQIAQALGLMGLPQRLAPGVKQIIMKESTGNPDAVNHWDSNASAGTPSKGLMQLIDTTFHNAVLPSLADRGIYDPIANITAGVRTMIANHGLDAVMDGGLRSSSGGYLGYGGAKLPTDGLGLAARS